MKKILGVLLLLFSPVLTMGATLVDYGLRRNSTGTFLDTVYCWGVVSDSLALRGIKLDSIRYLRYRGTTFIDSTKVTFGTDTLSQLGSFRQSGRFVRAFRASDASGNPGQYSVHGKIYSHDQTSANWEENYIWTYMVVTDPPGDTDTSDVSLAAAVSTNNDKTGYTLTGADKQIFRDTLFNRWPSNPANLISNGNFEQDSNFHYAVGKVCLGWMKDSGNVIRSPIAARSGKYGLMLRGDATNYGMAHSDSIYLYQGDWVTLSLDWRDEPTAQSRAFLRRGASAVVMNMPLDNPFWQTQSQRVYIPATDFYWLQLRTGATGASGKGTADTLWVDNVYMQVEPVSDSTAMFLASKAADSLSFLLDNPNNLLQNGGFETYAYGSIATQNNMGWTKITGTASVVINDQFNHYGRSGRKVLRQTGGTAKVISDSIYLRVGDRIAFGGSVVASKLAGSPAIALEDSASNPVVSLVVSRAGGSWETPVGTFRAQTKGLYHVALTSGTNIADTARFDQMFAYVLLDTTGGAASLSAADMGAIGDTVWNKKRVAAVIATTTFGAALDSLQDIGLPALRDSIVLRPDSTRISRAIRRMFGLQNAASQADSLTRLQRVVTIAGETQTGVTIPTVTTTTTATNLTTNNDKTGYTLTAADKAILTDSTWKRKYTYRNPATYTDSMFGRIFIDTLRGKMPQTDTSTIRTNLWVAASPAKQLYSSAGNFLQVDVNQWTSQTIPAPRTTGTPRVDVDLWKGDNARRIMGPSGSDTFPYVGLSPYHQSALYDTSAMAINLGDNLIHEPGFEGMSTGSLTGSSRYWFTDVVGGTNEVAIRPSGWGGAGRKMLRMKNALGVGQELISDSFYLPKGQRVIYGMDVYASALTGSASIAIGPGPVAVTSVPVANKWIRIYGYWKEPTASQSRWIEAIPAANQNDSMWVDNVFVYVFPDSTTPGTGGTASVDSSQIWRLLQHAWGKPSASYDLTYTDTDSLTLTQRVVTASGGVTVSFHSGTGNRTVTITTLDSAGGYPAVAGALVTLIDSTSHNVAGHLPSNISGITTFTVNDGGYYIKTSKPGFRPIYGSSPSPQDSIYLRVSGNTTRTDTVEGVAQILPVVAGKCNLYGYVQDALGDSLINGLEIQAEYANPPNKVECCSTDTTATVTIPKFFGTTTANVNGRWEFNLYPSSSLIPVLQYKISFKLNNTVVFTKVLTVSGVSQRFNP